MLPVLVSYMADSTSVIQIPASLLAWHGPTSELDARRSVKLGTVYRYQCTYSYSSTSGYSNSYSYELGAGTDADPAADTAAEAIRGAG